MNNPPLPTYWFGDLRVPQYMVTYNPVDTINQIRAHNSRRSYRKNTTTQQEDTTMNTCDHDDIWNYNGECSLCNAESLVSTLKQDRNLAHAQINGIWDILLNYDPSLDWRHGYASAAVREVVNKLDELRNQVSALEDEDQSSDEAPFRTGQWVEIPNPITHTGRYKVEAGFYHRTLSDWQFYLEGSGLPVRYGGGDGLRLWRPEPGETVYGRTPLSRSFVLGHITNYVDQDVVQVKTVDRERGVQYARVPLQDIRPWDDPHPTWGGTELPQ